LHYNSIIFRRILCSEAHVKTCRTLSPGKEVVSWVAIAALAVVAGLHAQAGGGADAVGLSLFFNDGTMKPLTFYGRRVISMKSTS